MSYLPCLHHNFKEEKSRLSRPVKHEGKDCTEWGELVVQHCTNPHCYYIHSSKEVWSGRYDCP